MFDHILEVIMHTFSMSPFRGATWFVLFILLFFVWIFMKASRDKQSPIHWEDLLIDTVTNKTSPYKLGYLVGTIVGTWVVITLTDRDRLTFDMLATYLSFLLGGMGWNTFITNKFGNGGKTPPPGDVR